jgi:hypothetical protein
MSTSKNSPNLLIRFNPFEIFNIFPTNQQAFNTFVILLTGKLLLNITVTWDRILIALFVGLSTEFIMSRVSGNQKPFNQFGSAVVASLATSIILRSSSWYVLPICLFFGISQKYFIKFKNRHFLNPSNFAVVCALALFTNKTYLDSQAWGGKYIPFFIVITTALLLLPRVKLLRVSIFLFSLFFALNYIFLTDNIPAILIKLSKITFLLYGFYIVNDPMALPSKTLYRLLHISIIVFLAFYLELFWGSKQITLPLALLVSSFLVPFWRIREKTNQTCPKEFAIIAALALFVGIGFYFSDFNLKRNFFKLSLPLSDLSSPSATNASYTNLRSRLSPEKWNEIWNHSNNFFIKNWQNKQIIKIPLKNTEKNPLSFTQIQNEISKYYPVFQLQDTGDDMLYYAPITAGDINHDGLLDIVLALPYGELKIFINMGNNDFTDITAQVFENVPKNIQAVALVDLNNDSHLDLVVIKDNNFLNQNDIVYLFNEQNKNFEPFYEIVKNNQSNIGGMAFADINNDHFLDIYLGYGLNWHETKPTFIKSSPYPNQFLVSDNGSYKNKLHDYFPTIPKPAFATMTTDFSDYNQDGQIDLLIGADYNDPSLIFEQKNKKFNLINKNLVESNTIASMSYFPIDIDSDGIFEIVEFGMANDTPSYSKNIANFVEKSKDLIPTQQSLDYSYLSALTFNHKFNCNNIISNELKKLCKILYLKQKAIETNNVDDICNLILQPVHRASCIRDTIYINTKQFSVFNGGRFDPEIYPMQIATNILLRKNLNGTYENIMPQNMLFSGWAWAAFPFDLNNDGLIDIYLTTGYGHYSHNVNRLFLNESHAGKIDFSEVAGDLKVDFEEESRGVMIADFNNNGTGNIIINNYGSHPIYLKNNVYGSAVEFELRSKSNYYALGAKIYLKTNLHQQLREVTTGGTWNTWMPSRIQFGLAENEVIKSVTIHWPDGEKEIRTDLEKNNLYVIYQ